MMPDHPEVPENVERVVICRNPGESRWYISESGMEPTVPGVEAKELIPVAALPAILQARDAIPSGDRISIHYERGPWFINWQICEEVGRKDGEPSYRKLIGGTAFTESLAQAAAWQWVKSNLAPKPVSTGEPLKALWARMEARGES